nr:carbohydrate kinase [Propionibacterium sp.]
MQPRLLCLGEALVDVVEQGGATAEHVGGSLLNVACGLARLGHDSTIHAWFGRDERGRRLRAWATDAGVRVAPGSEDADHTPVAYASLDAEGRATYTFDLEWRLPTPPDTDAADHLHTGSIAATLEPGGTAVVEAARRVRTHGTVSYDPNVRPALMVAPDVARPRVEELVALADVVKASDEDLAWLYGDEPVERTIHRLLALGPALVVVTRGPEGALAALAGAEGILTVDPLSVPLGDTVGAGDSFMAGLISGLVDAGLLGSRAAASRLAAAAWADVRPALARAAATSAGTVGRRGAYAPDRAEVERLLAGRG